MDVISAIQKRRSVRTFDYERPVGDADIMKILEAGRLAPSWKNHQPWRFVVVRSAEGRAAVADCLPEGNPARYAIRIASAVLVLLGVPEEGEVHQDKSFYLVDCGIAGENMYLEAVELGLSAVWVSLLDGPAVCRSVGAPEGWECVGVFPIGYALAEEEDKPRRSRRPLGEVAFLDRVGRAFQY